MPWICEDYKKGSRGDGRQLRFYRYSTRSPRITSQPRGSKFMECGIIVEFGGTLPLRVVGGVCQVFPIPTLTTRTPWPIHESGFWPLRIILWQVTLGTRRSSAELGVMEICVYVSSFAWSRCTPTSSPLPFRAIARDADAFTAIFWKYLFPQFDATGFLSPEGLRMSRILL